MTAMTLLRAGALGGEVTLNDVPSSISALTISAGPSVDCSCGLELQSDGDVVELEGVDQTPPTDRTVLGKYAATGSGLECRFTQNSGSAVVGTLNTWLALSTTRSVYLTDTSIPPSGRTANVTVEVRRGTTVLDSATFDLTTTIEGT